MIIWIGLIIVIAIIGFQIAIYKRRSKQLNNLESYAILLLLHDEFREAQKQTFSEYIKNSKQNSTVDLLFEAFATIGSVADNLAYQDNPYESSSFLSCKLIESIKGKTN